MITRIKVKNFKSLEDFELTNLTCFTCFIGLNGSGKTTLLQFLDFTRSLLLGRVTEWFARHKWNPSDIITFNSNKKTIEFEFDIAAEEQTYTWAARFNIQEQRCTYESLVRHERPLPKRELLFEDNKLKTDKKTLPLPPNFKQEGSIFSILAPLPPAPDFLLHTKVFGVLDPTEIAQASQTKISVGAKDVDPNGKGLVGFIASLSVQQQEELFRQLQEFYPQARSYKIRKQTFGWKNLLLKEIDNAFFDASHLSYGTLRLFVVLSQFFSDNQCLLFDEIENGINQELIEKLLNHFRAHPQKQVMITTHSALVINYLTDEEACRSVILLYKDALGHTHAKNFFHIPEISKQLPMLGPGEVMGATNLTKLSEKLGKQIPNIQER